MRAPLSPRRRGSLISLLISAQLLALDILTRLAVRQMLRRLALPPSLWTEAVHVAAIAILFVCLWLYYDSIDDRGFADFCQGKNDCPLWDIPAHSAGLTVTALTASPILCFSLYGLLAETGLHRVASSILAATGAVGFAVGGRFLLLARLRTLWTAQRDLVTGKKKQRSTLSRVLYAIVFFLSLCLAVWFGLAMCGHQIIKYAGLIPHIPLWLIGIALAFFLADRLTHFTAALLARRRFLARLAQLADRGAVTYTVEGHPYLSLLSSRLYAGVSVTHRTSVSNLRHETVYRVGLIRGGRRKSILILCRGQVYRFLHKLPGQGLVFQSGSRGRIIHKPMYAWFESKAFDLPEGEGEGVLLVEPFPAVIAEQIADEEECFWELGIGSRSFGYTVHSPNSFLHLLERT